MKKNELISKFALELSRHDQDLLPSGNFYHPGEWEEYDEAKANAIKMFFKLAGPEGHKAPLTIGGITFSRQFNKKAGNGFTEIPEKEFRSVFEELGFEFLILNTYQMLPTDKSVKAHGWTMINRSMNIFMGASFKTISYYTTEPEETINQVIGIINKKISDLIEKLPNVPEKTSATVYGIGSVRDSLNLITLNVKTVKNEDSYLDLAYPSLNKEKIQEFFDDDKATGKLLLFSGAPGTGKTTFIRHLFTTIDPGRRIILAGPELFDRISKPEFATFVMTNFQNAYLVVEDAEQLLLSRDTSRNPISQLLNYTDGLFGDAVNLRVIATFNTATENIDSALLRNGRLHHHEFFQPHNIEQATKFLQSSQNLAKVDVDEFMTQKLKENTEEISLCDLYALANETKKKNGTK